ncbi:hypothetical protein N7G274_007901 [Stereocaulon virgatum]|uniref:Carboxylesterase type B domain-containing protein n=1 Tax=Stereocaulon virgatum TaxID=373712 RepID=A0ABR4A7D3_9LECA
MLTLTLLLVFLPQMINARCKELVLDWGSYSATYDGERQGSCSGYSMTSRHRSQKDVFSYAPSPMSAPQTPVAADPPAPPSPFSCVHVDVQVPCTPNGDLFLVNSKCPKDPVGTLVEDCLFLDFYVPLQVLNGGSQVPVVVWFYAGAHAFGSKHQFDISKIPMYSGKELLTATPDPLIFVAGNYRLSAFGWLAGSYMEREALPNTGLYDQRMILEFVQENVGKVNEIQMQSVHGVNPPVPVLSSTT